MKRDLQFSKEKIYQGVEKLSKAVGSTLGPKGRPVLIEDEKGHGRPTKDGVTVARHTILSDREENLGAQFITQAASATVQVAGDGTTTSTVLAHAIIKGAEENVDFIKGIENAADDVVKYLESVKKDTTADLIQSIAYISTNSDQRLSEIITDAFMETGEDGIVDVKYAPRAVETTLDIKAGSYLPAGYSHQHFITNTRQRTCEMDEPYVLVSNATFNEITEIEHLLQEPLSLQRPIIIIADTEKNFNETFTANVQKGNIKGCLINPGYSASSDMLRDLAALLGGKYFDNANGNTFDYVGNEFWGQADSAVIGQAFALFTLPSNDHVQDRIVDLKELLETADDGMKGEYRSRLSMLNGKYATITVGAPTQGQALEIKDRIDDAVFAVGAAQRYGYLPGGGVALRDAANNIRKSSIKTAEGRGYDALLKAISYPYELILTNAGLTPDSDGLGDGIGYDASTGEVVDMVEAGIIDPALVTTQAVINAVSAAKTLLLCEATLIIAE